MRFFRYHAIGNDYIVMRATDVGDALSPAFVRRICDRNFGIGSDGILLDLNEPRSAEGAQGRVAGRVAKPGAKAAFAVRIFNPDGSESEKSGNGLRIFARYLWDAKRADAAPFSVTTPAGEVTCRVGDGGRSVTVDMGTLTFDSAQIPVSGPRRDVLRERMSVGGRDVEYSCASIGNPHCVLLRDRVSDDETRALGPLIEVDQRFPNRTNVQFVEVLDRGKIAIRIWERGAGFTLASGSSSCAAAGVAHKLGLCDADVTVHMPGGDIRIEIDPAFGVRMTGPVTHIADGDIDPESLEGAQ